MKPMNSSSSKALSSLLQGTSFLRSKNREGAKSISKPDESKKRARTSLDVIKNDINEEEDDENEDDEDDDNALPESELLADDSDRETEDDQDSDRDDDNDEEEDEVDMIESSEESEDRVGDESDGDLADDEGDGKENDDNDLVTVLRLFGST